MVYFDVSATGMLRLLDPLISGLRSRYNSNPRGVEGGGSAQGTLVWSV